MKKKSYLFIIVFSLVFILGNFACTIPTVRMSPEGFPQTLPDQQARQVDNNVMGDPPSRDTDNARMQQRQFQESEIDPTAGEFQYTETEVSYNWIDATSGTWNDLSVDEYVAIGMPFSFPYYGESFSTVYVSRHGWMSFYNSQPYQPWFSTGSSDLSFWYAFAPYATHTSAVYGSPGVYSLSLTSPNRIVIEYPNVYYENPYGEQVGRFQVVLYEDGTIDFNYDLVMNIGTQYYTVGLNHGAVSSNHNSHTFASFPVDDVTLHYAPPEKWIFITSPEDSVSSSYSLTWVGDSDVTIDMYHVFLDWTFYGNTTSNYMELTGLAGGQRYIVVYMETDSFNHTVSMWLLVDYDAPIISIDYPLDAGVNHEAKINWTASDPSSWIAYFQVYLNGSFYRTVYNSEMYLVVPNLHHYGIEVFAFDQLGHGASDIVTFFYNRTVTAVGFVAKHNEFLPWDVMNLYTNLGWVADSISDSLTYAGDLSAYDRLSPYDAVFVGSTGTSWPLEDIDILNSYLDGGGKLVVLVSWGFPAGLDTVMSNLGIGIESITSVPENYTTDFLTEHPLMSSITGLYYGWLSISLTTSFPAAELIRTSDSAYVIGSVVDMGSEKVLCLVEGVSMDVGMADNAILFENIITNWMGVEDHDLRVGLGGPGALGFGQPSNLTAYVLNQGSSTESGFSIELWVDEVLQDSFVVASLDSGEWTSYEFGYTATTIGPVNVTAYVEPVVGETVTFNNVETRMLDVYSLIIIEPVPGQFVRGGLVYIDFTATDMENLVNITAYVNSVEMYKIAASGSGAFGNGVFVPVFTNGTNVIALVTEWANGASANTTISVESYGVVPIVSPSPGDYIDFFVVIQSFGTEMFNLTVLGWLSPFELNATLYVNVTMMGSSQAFETWIVFSALNGYVSQVGSAMPLSFNLLHQQCFFFSGLSAPEPAPYSTSIDLGCLPAASIGDLMCFMSWNNVVPIFGSGNWNGYATHIAGYDMGTYVMTLEVLQCNGMFVKMNQTYPGMSTIAQLVASNMLPPGGRAPIVSSPDNMNIAEDATGFSITWVASGNYPTTYSIYVDNQETESNGWTVGVPLVYDLVAPGYGSHNYSVVFRDNNGMWTMDTVWVYGYDTIAPTVDSPTDMRFEQDTAGISITWSPYDSAPNNYTILRDGSVVYEHPWSGGAINYVVDDLVPGEYNFTLLVFDAGDHAVVDTVIVTVDPAAAPTINSPNDMAFDVGTAGRSINWTASDSYPWRWELLRNGVIFDTDYWDGENIVISLDGLGVGTFNFTITIYDDAQHSARDTVIVTVNAVTPTTTTTTSTTTTTTTTTTTIQLPPYIMIIAIAGFGGLVIIIVLILIVRRK